MLRFYILRGKTPVEVTSDHWTLWDRDHYSHRTIMTTILTPRLRVRTRFVGLRANGINLHFKTVIKGGTRDGRTWWTPSYRRALIAHHEAIAMAVESATDEEWSDSDLAGPETHHDT